MNYSRSLFTFLLTAALLATLGAGARGDTDAFPSSLRSALQARLTASEGRRGTAACVVVDLESGDTLFNFNGNKPLTPASNMKLLTTAAGLLQLGSEFEYKTQLLADADVRDGALQGPLFFLGGGDPNLSGRFHDGDNLALFKGWATKLKQAGIRSIEGGIRYDSTIFGGDSFSSGWPQDDQYIRSYCAQVSALAFNDNCIGIRVLPTKAGQPATIELSPPTAYVKVVNETRTAPGRKGAEIGIVRPRGENTITVKGTVYEQATWGYFVDVTVDDPARYAATVLRETLQAEGIRVGGNTEPQLVTPEIAARCRVLVEHRSPLTATLGPINTNSQNLHAEMLFRMLGARYTGKGTFKTSQAALEHFVKEQGWHEPGLVFADGSGLARDNLVTASLLSRVLLKMSRGDNFDAYRDSLAGAGESGTLEKRLKELRGKVYAKTGYIRGVHALSGYLLMEKRRLAFSILMNDCVNSKSAQDEIVTLLADAMK